MGIYAIVSTFSAASAIRAACWSRASNSTTYGCTLLRRPSPAASPTPATIAATGSQAVGIYVDVPTFSGGINNSGTISAHGDSAANGVYVASVSTFYGGVADSDLIAVSSGDEAPRRASIWRAATDVLRRHHQLREDQRPRFLRHRLGIYVGATSTFQGGITNSGTIIVSAGESAFGVYLAGGSTFSGGITNSGLIRASGIQRCGRHLSGVFSTFSGGVTN